jgi:hypothetical protein
MHIAIGWWLIGLLHKAALPHPPQLFPRPKLAVVEALDAIAQRLLDVADVSDQAFKGYFLLLDFTAFFRSEGTLSAVSIPVRRPGGTSRLKTLLSR